MMSKSVKTNMLYQDADTRNYTFDASDSITPNAVREKINAINASITGGTDNGFSQTFTSDNGANLTKISGASIITEVDTIIFGGEF